MIKNDRQLKCSDEAINDLIRMSLNIRVGKDIPKSIEKLVENHVEEMMSEIQKEIQEYQDLKKGLCPERKSCNFTYKKACQIQCCDGCPREKECTIKCFFVSNKKSE